MPFLSMERFGKPGIGRIDKRLALARAKLKRIILDLADDDRPRYLVAGEGFPHDAFFDPNRNGLVLSVRNDVSVPRARDPQIQPCQ